MTRKPLEAWQRDDAARLRKLFADKTSLTQEAFGAQFEIGTQGMVWQYLQGRAPLNLLAALRFARGLGVPLEAISPTLAAQLQQAARSFPGVAEDLNGQLRYLLRARFPGLDDAEVAEVMGFARGLATAKRSNHGDDNR